MRFPAVALFVVLASLLTVPLVSAEPVPPRCAEKEIAPGVSLNANCGLTVEYALMSCPISGSWKEHHVENHVVRYYTCDSP